MPISQKILDRISQTNTTPEAKQLMLEILELEDKGVFRFETAYEKAIKKYVSKVTPSEVNK